MKVCICRNIPESTIRNVLTGFFKGIAILPHRREHAPDAQKPTLDDLHETASEGQGFRCGKCACAMAEMVHEHNRGIQIDELRQGMETAAAAHAVRKVEP